jgi:hypothetical protein
VIGWGHVALGDLDGDGDLDALVTNSEAGSRVWLNDGDAHFTPNGGSLGASSHHLALGDLDGDDDLDACVTQLELGNTVWINDGAAGFSSAGRLLGDRDGLAITLADLDADLDLDVFVGKPEQTGGNRLYFNTSRVDVEALSWGRVKSLHP